MPARTSRSCFFRTVFGPSKGMMAFATGERKPAIEWPKKQDKRGAIRCVFRTAQFSSSSLVTLQRGRAGPERFRSTWRRFKLLRISQSTFYKFSTVLLESGPEVVVVVRNLTTEFVDNCIDSGRSFLPTLLHSRCRSDTAQKVIHVKHA